MGVFSRFALRTLRLNRARTIVSIAGIALACALITAVLTSALSLSDMLYERTADDEGAWQAEIIAPDETALDRIASDADVTSYLPVAELGAVALAEPDAEQFGSYLFLKTYPAQTDGRRLVPAPELTEGREPRAPGEILLPSYLKGAELDPSGLVATGPIELGDAVTLTAGTRLAGDTENGPQPAPSDVGSWAIEGETYTPDLGTETYTVVGFYRNYGISSTSALSGNCAFVYDDETAARAVLSDGSPSTCLYVPITVRDANACADVVERIVDGTQTTGANYHTSLLRWQGVTGDASIWNTLYLFAGVLAAVVMVAGISLIYNSFAISVAERTRQFGLLSSLGASRRQLRGTVLTEALMLGAVGIPAGILLGLAGCHVVFGFLGEGIASMLDIPADSGSIVVVNPVALGISAALALVVLLVSAWTPAWRAARVSAVDAVRQTQDIRLTRRAQRRAERAARLDAGASATSHPTRPGGLAARLFGVPGYLAHRTLSRAASKGRVTVAALAVSTMLLVFAGSFANQLTFASDTALQTAEGTDLQVTVEPNAADEDELDRDAFAGTVASLSGDVAGIENARLRGSAMHCLADVTMPASLFDPSALPLLNKGSLFSGSLDGDTWAGTAYVEFIDDASWRAYIEELGLSAETFCDSSAPRAVLLDSYVGSDNATYNALDGAFSDTGTVDAVTFREDAGGLHALGFGPGDDGSAGVWYSDDEGNPVKHLPLAEATERKRPIEVGALASEVPDCLSGWRNSDAPLLVLPVSAFGLADVMHLSSGSVFIGTDGSAQLAADVQQDIETIAVGYTDINCTYSNYAEMARQNRLMATVINTFIFCFVGICGLIAMANVFNTLSNSLILRRREFAVLKSVGMGNRAFRAMIVYECASYALRGFAIGLALATLASFGLFYAVSLSFTGMHFTLPWAYVGIAAALVALVIIVSCVYALRKNRSASIVEALRADAI